MGLLALLAGLFFGVIAGLQFSFPTFLKDIPFYKTRPLHVSLVVAWIFLSSIGGIYYYLPKYNNVKIYSKTIGVIHFLLFLVTGIIILACYFNGVFGGREYWEFPPILAIPILLSWIIFGWNYFKTAFRVTANWPVYMWMWATGIVFFFFTFTEAYVWLLPSVKQNIIKEITLQWKAYGALVGSWNMLVYGTSIFLMEKIKGDLSIGRSNMAFLMYFLGLTNLMFGWAHHIYNVPSAIWIRYVSYLVSMTELIILFRIIYGWRKSLTEYAKDFYLLPYKFLVASDIWIFFNLCLAITISIPAINIYTHGTHITVAHAMGSTIGINTMILLSSCFFVIEKITLKGYREKEVKIISWGYVLFNVFFAIFWLTLIGIGMMKGIDRFDRVITFQESMNKLHPAFVVFAISGLGIFGSLLLIVIYPLRNVWYYFISKD